MVTVSSDASVTAGTRSSTDCFPKANQLKTSCSLVILLMPEVKDKLVVAI